MNKVHEKHPSGLKGVDPHYKVHIQKAFSVIVGILTANSDLGWYYGTAHSQRSKIVGRNHENHKIRHCRLTAGTVCSNTQILLLSLAEACNSFNFLDVAETPG